MERTKVTFFAVLIAFSASASWAGIVATQRPNPTVYNSSRPVAAQGGGGGGGGGDSGPSTSTSVYPSVLSEFIPNVTYFVNPMSADGGNGTSWSIDPADPNRAFKYLKHWEGLNLNITAAGTNQNVRVILHSTRTYSDPYSQTADTPTVSISGWITDATHRIHIVASSFSVAGTSIPEHGYIYTPTTFGNAISLSDGNIIWEGITTVSSGTSTGANSTIVNIGAVDANTTNYFLGNYFGCRFEGDETEGRAVYGGNANVKTTIFMNNYFVGLDATRKAPDGTSAVGFAAGVKSENANNTFYLFNNHFSNLYTSIEHASGLTVAINNTSQNSGTTAYSGCGSGSDRNLSEDTSTCGQDPVTSQAVTYVGESTLNFRLANNDTGAANKGISLATSTVFASLFDIEGGTRSATAGARNVGDLGPDEIGTSRQTVANP
jgi:hypothetical protein